MIVYTQGQQVQVIDEYVGTPLPSIVVAVDAATRYQTMDGWEATAIGWQVSKATNLYDPTWVTHAPAVMARLVNEMGVDRLQLPIRSGWHNTVDYWPQFQAGTIGRATLEQNWYKSLSNGTPQFGEFDFNVQHMLQPFLTATAGKPRVVSLIFTDFGATGKTLDFSLDPAAYAAFLKVYVDRLAAIGVTVDCIDIVLEPENSGGWIWGGRIGAAAVALKALLPNVKLIAPSMSFAYNVLPAMADLEAIPGALAAVDTVSYHRYGGGNTEAGQIKAYADARGKRTGMTEWISANFDTLLDDLMIGGVSTFQRWNIACRVGSGSNPQAGYYLFDGTNVGFATNGTVGSGMFPCLFPFVRLGAQRIGCTAPAAELPKVVAFENVNGKRVVTVKRTLAAAQVGFTGLTPGAYGVRTTPNNNSVCTDLPDVVVGANGQAVLTIPKGFTTLYAR